MKNHFKPFVVAVVLSISAITNSFGQFYDCTNCEGDCSVDYEDKGFDSPGDCVDACETHCIGVPLSSDIWMLLLAGGCFAFYTLSKRKVDTV